MTDDSGPPDPREWQRQAAEHIREAVAAGRVDLADKAISMLGAAAADPGLRGVIQGDLGAALMARFDITGDRHSLAGALAAFRSVLSQAPGEPRSLSNLGLALIRSFELTDDTQTLLDAIGLLRQAVAGTTAPSAQRASYLSNLGLALVRLAERTGSPDPAAEAAAVHAAAAGMETGPGRKAAMLANLGAANMVAYRLGDGAARLQAAVDTYQDAVATAPPGHAYARGCLAGLGEALAAAASAHGETALSVTAIATLRSAVRQLPPSDPDGPLFLSQLAEALRRAYALTGDTRALAESIGCRRAALARTPAGHPARLHYQANLAMSLRNRFEAAGDPGDLHEARELISGVLAAAPADHPDRSKWQADLAHILRRLAASEHDEASLAEAAEMLRSAIAEAGPGHHDLLMHRVNLGGVLVNAVELRWRQELYDEAVDALGQALPAAAPGTPERADLLLSLGLAHAARFRADQSGAACQAAAAALSEAGRTVTAPAGTRARAARYLAAVHARAGDAAAAAGAYADALELLDLVTWRGLARDDQERMLADFRGLGPAAAAAAIEAGDADRALSLLEQGRGVLLSQVLELRAGHQQLRDVEPGLAAELDEVHDAMEAAARGDLASPGEAPEETQLARHELAVRRSGLLAAIRERPGLSRFLLPPDAAALRSPLPDGAVVALNVAETRCDAIITTSAATTVLPLPGLAAAEAAERAALFLAAVTANAWGTNDVLLDVLAWLWDAAVGPVLGALEGPPGPPRIWWMPTGPLSLLPVHAAGHHRRRDGDHGSALHRALSSYTPNLRIMSRPAPAPAGPRAGLVVGAGPDTGPQAEAAAVAVSRPGRVIELLGPAATKQAVLAELPACAWAHIAGHAVTDLRQPSESRLILSGGALRVREITAVRGAAELAYLSACETAAGSARLPDEAIHIGTAFQLAGFRNVIGTLWRVPDRCARDTAAAIYDRLGRCQPARAVNLAARRQRDAYRANPYEWAAFIHSGPG